MRPLAIRSESNEMPVPQADADVRGAEDGTSTLAARPPPISTGRIEWVDWAACRQHTIEMFGLMFVVFSLLSFTWVLLSYPPFKTLLDFFSLSRKHAILSRKYANMFPISNATKHTNISSIFKHY